MRDRDSNETGHSHASPSSPDVTLPEGPSRPLITEDYGVTELLEILIGTARRPDFSVTHSVKVAADGRLVVEFQAHRLSGAPVHSPFDYSVELPCGSRVPKGWPR